jgi:hypothetical protein
MQFPMLPFFFCLPPMVPDERRKPFSVALLTPLEAPDEPQWDVTSTLGVLRASSALDV